MSTYNLQKRIRRELEILNKRIDEKIMRGLSYAGEAKRHKALLLELYGLKRKEVREGFFSSLFSTV